MIAKLNLLPWREEKKRLHRQRFVGLLAASAVAAAFVVLGAGSFIERQQSIQHARNAQIQQEIQALEHKLAMLPEMDRQREALVQRLAVITDIQKGRNHVTRLMSLMPGIVPQGVYLDGVSMTGSLVKLGGAGDSNGRLATLLSNGETSEWVEDITMHSIVTKTENQKEQTNFNASFILLSPPQRTEEGGRDG